MSNNSRHLPRWMQNEPFEPGNGTRLAKFMAFALAGLTGFYLAQNELRPNIVSVKDGMVNGLAVEGASKSAVPSGPLGVLPCGAECRFLFPAHIGGQETRAQEHIYRYGLMAVAMNRTLVLPNVAHSQIGACLERNFTYYYAPDSLSRFGVPTITQHDFQSWLVAKEAINGRTPTNQVLSLEQLVPLDQSTPELRIEIGSPYVDPKADSKIACLTKLRLNNTDYPPVRFIGDHSKGTAKGTLLFTNVVSFVRGTLASEPDVVTLSKIAPFWTVSRGGVDLPTVRRLNPSSHVVDHPFNHLVYSQGWSDLTAAVATKLEPFIAVHWRSESVPRENLVRCADALIAKLTHLKRTNPSFSYVFLATDYPFEGLNPGTDFKAAHSSSYHIFPEAHTAFRKLWQWFQDGGAGLKQSSWYKQSLELEFPESTRELVPEGTRVRDLDPSLLGMIDKNIVYQSSYFVAGQPNQCGKTSSWTKSVQTARTEARSGQGEFIDKDIKNVVDYFSL